MTTLEQNINYFFKNKQLFIEAMTHSSFSHENKLLLNNERFEFLGDSLLDCVIAEILFEKFPNYDEGKLSQFRANLVNARSLSEIAMSIDLDQVIKLGNGLKNDKTNINILSGAFEALIAAIYFDGGFVAINKVIKYLFEDMIYNVNNINVDYKTKLQEKTQAKLKKTPNYTTLSSKGPDHCKIFKVAVDLNETNLAIAEGRSKKEAEQNAAKLALKLYT
jgi:ribonuclease-3